MSFAGQEAKLALVDIAEAESKATVERKTAETGNKLMFIECDIRGVAPEDLADRVQFPASEVAAKCTA
jgi:hypothetical protein